MDTERLALLVTRLLDLARADMAETESHASTDLALVLRRLADAHTAPGFAVVLDLSPTLGILAMVAEQEHETISARTKAALASNKARGTALGNPNGAAALRRAAKGNTASIAMQVAAADQMAERLVSTVGQLRPAFFIGFSSAKFPSLGTDVRETDGHYRHHD